MANILSLIVSPCSNTGFTTNMIIDDPTSSVMVGDTYYYTSNTFGSKVPNGCYTVLFIRSSLSSPTGVLTSQYTDCTECLSENSNGLVFKDCAGIYGSFVLDKTSFSPLPTLGDTYFLEIYVSGKGDIGGVTKISACFEFVGFTQQSSSRLELFSATTYASCEECSLSSPITYSVIECLSQTTYYVQFPSNVYDGHLVTFTDIDGITQYCGVVEKQLAGASVTGLLVSDLGVPQETGVTCEDCLNNVAEKKKLINCVDGHEDIVWASTLFTAGDATNISSGQGCYEISPDPVDPETPVTYNELANFDPHSGCEDCIECHGVTYDFSSCTEVSVCGEVSGYTFMGEKNGYDIIIDDVNGFAYLTFNGTYNVIKFDLNTNSVVWTTNIGYLPGKIGLDVTNNILSVPNSIVGGGITFIDTTTGSFITQSLSPGYTPRVSYFNTNDNLFYVGLNTNFGSSEVYVYSASAYNSITFITSFGCGLNPTDILQVGSYIYVSSLNNITIYDLSYNLVNTIPVSQMSSLAYNPSLNKIYATGFNNFILEVDPITWLYTYRYPSFNSCCCEKTVMYNTSNNKIYVSDPCPNEIYEIDENTFTISNTFTPTTDNQPYGLAEWSGNTCVITNSSLIELGCTLNFITGSINSYEYLPTGNTFFHPILSACCEITNVRADMDGQYDFLSLISYDDCASCGLVNHELFYCEECNTGQSGLMVAQSGQYTIGDYVKSHWGNSNFLCFQIIDTWSPSSQIGPSVIFETESHLPYSSCAECESGSTIGITVINCDTLVESQVNITLSDWLQITGFFSPIQPANFSSEVLNTNDTNYLTAAANVGSGIPKNTISDSEGNCYTIVNSCPVDNVYPELSISNFYLNEIQCRLANAETPIPPRSANTESTVCVICCECGSTGSTVNNVNPPHPVWTDGYGTSVTQLNAIVLGGPNGLNS